MRLYEIRLYEISLYEILFSVSGIAGMLQGTFYEVLDNSLNPRLNFRFEKKKKRSRISNSLSTNLTKWSNTIKQFVRNSQRIVGACLIVDLALKVIKIPLLRKLKFCYPSLFTSINLERN